MVPSKEEYIMLKKSLVVMMMGGFISALTAFPVLANTWLVDPTTYKHATTDEEWLKAEALAELKQWTDARKDAILALPDDAQRYDAIVNAVCDFLEYDAKYTYPFISYTLRDGKGVCGDYTVLTKSLCDAVGIPCDIVFGNYLNASHSWNKVTLMGKTYYSDVTSVEAGLPAYKLSSVLWSDHEERAVSNDIWAGINTCGRDISEDVETSLATPAGTVMFTSPSGTVFYVSQEDTDAFNAGTLSPQELGAKYGVN